MKHSLKLILAVAIFCTVANNAKSQAGLFASDSDFIKNKIATVDDDKSIQLHDAFYHSPYITIRKDGRKIKYKKSSLYGYRDEKNETFRFYNNAEYKIAEAGNIFIYTRQESMAMSKGYKIMDRYYFSYGANGAILLLNMKNMKAVFSNNEVFIHLIEQLNGKLNDYSSTQKMFTINYLYLTAVNNK